MFLSQKQYRILLYGITGAYYCLCPNWTLKRWKRNYHFHCFQQVKQFITLIQTNDKMYSNKNIQQFYRFSICSVTKESHNGRLGLIAVDYTNSRGVRRRVSVCEWLWIGKGLKEFRAAVAFLELSGDSRSNAALDLMPHSPFLIYALERSQCFAYSSDFTSTEPVISSPLSWRDSAEYCHAARTDCNGRGFIIFRVQDKKPCAQRPRN